MASTAQSKQNQVYETMRARLTDGNYPPGHRVNAAEIARELGVSNIPVREALHRLEAEGWLEHAPNAGMRVAERDPQAWVDLMTPFAVLSGYATAEAAEALRAGDGLDELRRLNAQMRAALEADDFAAATAANAAFHQRIFDSVPNVELGRSLSDTWTRLNVMRRALYGAIPLRAFQSLGEHEALIDMMARDADRFEIESTAREHLLQTVHANRAARALTDRAAAPASASGSRRSSSSRRQRAPRQ